MGIQMDNWNEAEFGQNGRKRSPILFSCVYFRIQKHVLLTIDIALFSYLLDAYYLNSVRRS